MSTSGFVIGLEVYWDLILKGTVATWFLNFAFFCAVDLPMEEVLYYSSGFALTSFLIFTFMGCVYIPYRNAKEHPEDYED